MSEGSLSDKFDGDRRVLTPEEFLEKLRHALTRNGDFPASAKIVTELRMLTQDPSTTAAKLAEVILREPSLGVRLLHLVNSSFYKRAKPVSTISQAIVQIGMKPLAEMCGGLVLLQRFVPEARQNSAFASCLRKSIVTSIISSSLVLQGQQEAATKRALPKNSECGYLAGTMAEIGVLLMAYYFPQVYDSAVKRCETRRQELSVSIQQIIGLSPAQLSSEVIRTLNLPQYYADVVMYAEQILTEGVKFVSPIGDTEVIKHSRNLGAALGVSEIVTSARPAKELLVNVKSVRDRTDVSAGDLTRVLHELQSDLNDHCRMLELKLPDLPADLSVIELLPGSASEVAVQAADTTAKVLDLGERQAQFEQYLEEIRLGILNSEPTSNILTSVMEACAYCLLFDRVLLLLANQGRRSLVGRMMLGSAPNFDPKSYSRPLGDEADPYAPDNNAFMHGRPAFQGDSLFGDGWPIAAIPVGSGKKAVGVVYCERTVKGGKDLSPQEQAALVMLTNLLDKSIQRVANNV